MSGGELYERAMSEPLTSALASSSLLPTPSSEESTPTDEYVSEMVAAGIQPHERLYLPNRKWHAQRTLSSVAPALLQTPSAADALGGHLSRGGDRKDELLLKGQVKELLPTPTTEPMTANGHARNLGKEAKLLPTPMHRDDRGTTRRLPTPRAHAIRSSRKAMVENQQWSAPSLEQAVELASGTLPREFKTWEEVPGSSGASTSQPSADGKPSPDQLPGQLTIEAA